MLKIFSVSFFLIALYQPSEAIARSSGGGGCCAFVHSYVRRNGTFVHSYIRSLPGYGRTTVGTANLGSNIGSSNETGAGASQLKGLSSQADEKNSEQDAPAVQEYRPIFKANDLCKGHKIYGNKNEAGVCIFGGREETE